MTRRNDPEPLPRRFYARDVREVAEDLLGCMLVRRIGAARIGGRIVETEAYGGPGDVASHAHRWPNGRARIMFGEPGRAYVYFTYGMHHCVNATAEAEGVAGAVLIRALEPVWGTSKMRGAGAPDTLPDDRLASGPGRLCRSLRIDRDLNGADLTSGPLVVADGDRPSRIECGPRIGLSADDGRRWRLWTPSVAVSRRR